MSIVSLSRSASTASTFPSLVAIIRAVSPAWMVQSNHNTVHSKIIIEVTGL